MIPYHQSIALDLVGSTFARPEFRHVVLAMDEKLFLSYADFFRKTKKFHSGIMPGYSAQEWDMVREFEANLWCPPVIDKMIAQLKREYIQHEIATTRLTEESDINKLAARVLSVKETDTKTIKDCLWEILEEEENGIVHGIPTGINQIDAITVGLKPGHFWIVGGYTGVGKTNIALEIVRNVAKNHGVIFFSLEMTQKDLVRRIKNIEQIDVGAMAACDTISKMDLKIIDNKNKLEDIETYLAVLPTKPKLVVIDFIQNVETEDKNEYERLSKVARRLQAMALREGICIVGLSQVSNESVNAKNKTMGFKGSGAIAAACDVGIELIRDHEAEKENGNATQVEFICIVRKNRHGRDNQVLRFVFDKTKNMILFEKQSLQKPKAEKTEFKF